MTILCRAGMKVEDAEWTDGGADSSSTNYSGEMSCFSIIRRNLEG